MAHNPEVSTYFTDGCGRCALAGTPQCRVHLWPEALARLRELAIASGLTETRKWGVPCYVNESGKNVALLGAFKGHCLISFFKGALLNDPSGMLEKPGSNSQAARQLRFTDGASVEAAATDIARFLQEAIAIEATGQKIVFKSASEYAIPEEFQLALDEDAALNEAFHRLTPGRRRAYLMHFGQAKQSKTRVARIEAAKPDILNGIGLHDQYQSNMKTNRT